MPTPANILESILYYGEGLGWEMDDNNISKVIELNNTTTLIFCLKNGQVFEIQAIEASIP